MGLSQLSLFDSSDTVLAVGERISLAFRVKPGRATSADVADGGFYDQQP